MTVWEPIGYFLKLLRIRIRRNSCDKIAKIKELYNKGENLIAWLKESDGRTKNSFEDIMISYDFQAGTYVQEFEKNKIKPEYMEYYAKIAEVIRNYLCEFNTANLFEAGVGEATTLGPVLNRLPLEKLGADCPKT